MDINLKKLSVLKVFEPTYELVDGHEDRYATKLFPKYYTLKNVIRYILTNYKDNWGSITITHNNKSLTILYDNGELGNIYTLKPLSNILLRKKVKRLDIVPLSSKHSKYYIYI